MARRDSLSVLYAYNGRDNTRYERRHYICKSRETRFDDLNGTILAGHLIPTIRSLDLSKFPHPFDRLRAGFAKGEYARDDDGDGFCEVHVDTMKGCWSLLRSWLRPHLGISREKLPSYLGFFEVVHNARKRGKALLGALSGALLEPVPPP